ncbi:class I SAM-dependent methyltransferase [Dyella jiangningensis]|uniref:class I SAM-dependent methyltransferase n=1 Tax=Dyella jiangningensis TaxID=1379159 RepID=UPI00240F9FD1|nr:class I SAM-dependent methyltransferase [Dyella jiangningensis]MDG2536625.1 class I SAM-dependent methyltransferase [Dyella jiangningensis]
MKELIKRIPVIGPVARSVYLRWIRPAKPFHGSEDYWITRYRDGGNSGAGSYNRLAEFKADVLNDFVASHDIRDVIEFGCGDGNQLTLARYPSYLGLDVSPDAVERCSRRFAGDASKSFMLVQDYAGQTAQLAISLDVIYHLTEDEVYEMYMQTLFGAAREYVVIYSSDVDESNPQSPHVRHHQFSQWVRAHAPGWRLLRHIPNRYPYTGDNDTGSLADFYIYGRGSVT